MSPFGRKTRPHFHNNVKTLKPVSILKRTANTVESGGTRRKRVTPHKLRKARSVHQPARLVNVRETPSEAHMNIPGYDIFEIIGRGGTSTVYRARQRSLDRDAAVKVLRDEFLDDENQRQRFIQGGKRAATIVHPASITVYETGETSDGHLFIAMELISGGSLKDAINLGMAEEDAVSCLLQVCDALAAAHRADIVHGDIKPHNILLRDLHQAVLTDYSGAAEEDFSKAGYTVGSPYYISPEQVQGQTPEAASDLYSIGALLFEVLARHPPFQGETAGETAELHLHADIPKLEGRYKIYNPALQRMLSKSPAERYPSMAQAAYNIRRALKLLTDFNERPQSGAVALEPTAMGLQLPPLPEEQHLHDTQIVPLRPTEETTSTADSQDRSAVSDTPAAGEPPHFTDSQTMPVKTPGTERDPKLPDFGSDLADTRTIPTINAGLHAEIPDDHEPAVPHAAFALDADNSKNTSPSQDSKKHSSIAPALLWLAGAAGLAFMLWKGFPEAREELEQTTSVMGSMLESPAEHGAGEASDNVALEIAPSSSMSVNNAQQSSPSTESSSTATKPQEPQQTVSPEPVARRVSTPDTTAKISPVLETVSAGETAPAVSGNTAPMPNRIITADDLTLATPGDVGGPMETFELVEYIDDQEAPSIAFVDDGSNQNQSMEFSLAMHADLLTRHDNGDISLFIKPQPGYHKSVARLDQASQDKLEQLNYILRNNDGFDVRLIDHRFTEPTVSKKYSAQISDYLKELGLPGSRIQLGNPLGVRDHAIELRLVAPHKG